MRICKMAQRSEEDEILFEIGFPELNYAFMYLAIDGSIHSWSLTALCDDNHHRPPPFLSRLSTGIFRVQTAVLLTIAFITQFTIASIVSKCTSCSLMILCDNVDD